MAVRTLGIVAAIGLIAAGSAHADPSSGDIVDQVLQTLPPTGSPPAPPPPPPSPSPGPTSLAPKPVNASAAPNNADILDQAMQVLPARPEGFLPAGAYFGVNLGGGTTHGGSGETCVNSVTNDTTGCVALGNGGFNTRGVLGGGQVGYLKLLDLGQSLPLVVGIEADFQGTGISGTQNVNGPFSIVGFPMTCTPCGYTASQSLDWFGTLRARIGVPVDQFFIYGTGGLMVGALTTTQSLSFAGSPGYVSNAKSTHSGPVAGAGVEYFIPDSPLSAKFEALYYDLGKETTITASQPGFAANFSERKTFGFSGTIIRIGLNLRLGAVGGF